MVCRSAAGVCDIAETCDGNAGSCPAGPTSVKLTAVQASTSAPAPWLLAGLALSVLALAGVLLRRKGG